ncbi:class 3 adenylate cyclase [Stakelama pacifica]|uniref:Class 3 adenylate cyclase n=1 Tax=Stakelama pacifica TaxID=517720 RepID=A0A4R6FS06_9SPHN|nr:class 3 adenylate cyclase [Stakelama pacifica]
MRARFDFEIEPIRSDEATQMVTVRIQPNRRRYSIIEVNGERHYLDKFLRTIVSEEAVKEMAVAKFGDLPLIYNPPSIESASQYASVRQGAIAAELRGESYVVPTEKARPQSQLSFAGGTRFLTFLSVDICGSSGLRRRDPEGFERAYGIFLRELATSVGHFHGAILKTTGDGFIATIDSEGYTTQCDNTVDLGLTFLAVMRGSVNPALEAAGLPLLTIRVGADCGAARLRKIIVPATGFEAPEVASDALNRAVKIEQTAAANELRIGRGLYELVHVQWLERCEEVEFDGAEVGIEGYQVYKVE